MKTGVSLSVKSVDRWEIKSNRHRRAVRIRILVGLLCCAGSIFAISALLPASSADRDIGNHAFAPEISSKLAEELRQSVSTEDTLNTQSLLQAVSKLTTRIEALEGQNLKLAAEVSELTREDGVIDRVVTHIRALHALSEATRRDVVNAIMTPVPESRSAIDADRLGSDVPSEGEASPFLSKARHRIVTPSASEQVAEKSTPSAKPKGRPAQIEAGEGDTN